MSSLRTIAVVVVGLASGLVFACGGNGTSSVTTSGTSSSSSSSTTSSSTAATSSSTGTSTSSSGAGGHGGTGGQGAGGLGVGGAGGGAGGGVNAPCKVDADCKSGLVCTCPNDACHDCGGMTGSCAVMCMGG